jgi:hypothetical protein
MFYEGTQLMQACSPKSQGLSEPTHVIPGYTEYGIIGLVINNALNICLKEVVHKRWIFNSGKNPQHAILRRGRKAASPML